MDTTDRMPNVDSLDFGRYSSMAVPQWAAEFSSSELTIAHNRASGFFVCGAQVYPNYGGLGRGAERLAGFYCDRSANPVQVTTSCLAAACGELSKLTIEAATMATTLTQTQPEVTLVDGRAVTTSIAIAEYFTKRHADVIRKIETLEFSPEFNARNFASVEYTDAKGEKRPAYEITRDGFAFLAMGFTGKRAAIFKEHYINAFNMMEAKLSAGVSAFPERIELLITLENGAIVDSRPVQKGEVIASLDTFIELTERRGYLVIHPDDLKSLSLGHKKREG